MKYQSRAAFFITSLLFSFFINALSAKTHLISLKDKSITADVDFGISNIIDARDQKATIGFVYKGIAPKRTPADFETSLEEELGYIFRDFPQKKSDRSYRLRVNRLFIYEVITPNNTTAHVELNVSILEKRRDGYVELLNVITNKERSGMDGTALHSKNIVAVLEDCLRYFGNRQKANQLLEISMGKDPIAPINRPPSKILTVDKIPRGIFRNFSDFRDLLLEETPFQFTKDYLEKQDAVVAELYTMQEKRLKGAWGFSDGEHLYINLGRSQYFKANKKGKEYWVNHGKGKYNMGLPLLFGAIGAGMAAMDNPDERGEKVSSKLDMTTGNMVIEGSSPVEKVEAKVYVSNSHYNKEGVNIEVLVDGNQQCQIQPGSYALVKIPANTNSIELCVKHAGSQSCESIQPEFFTNKVYLVRAKPEKKPKMTQLTGDTFMEYFRKIKEEEFVNACPQK